MKGPMRVVVVVIVLVAGLLAAKNVVAKAMITGGVRVMTGLRLSIGSMNVGLLASSVGVRDLKLYNPAGFDDPVMVDLPELFVDYDLPSFLSGTPHFEEVRLNLREFTVVKAKDGTLNLDALNVVKESKGAAKGKAEPAKKTGSIKLDALELHIGTVTYKDYAGGGEPAVQQFPVNIHERYEHISNPYALGGLIVTRALMQTSIARLANFELGDLQSLANVHLQQAEKLVGDAFGAARVLQDTAVKQITDPSKLLGTAEGTAKGAADAGKEAAGEAVDAAKKATQAFKNIFGGGAPAEAR
jgi:hypothetical protein